MDWIVAISHVTSDKDHELDRKYLTITHKF